MNADGSEQRPLFSLEMQTQLRLDYQGVNERMLNWIGTSVTPPIEAATPSGTDVASLANLSLSGVWDFSFGSTALTQQGIRISQIQPEMLESGVSPEAGPASDQWKKYLDSMLAAIINFDEDRLEDIYNEALSLHSIGAVTRKLLTPLLVELGLRWEGGEPVSIAEEHFFAFYLRNKLGARFHHRPRRNTGPMILLAGLPGEHHDIGLLLFALALIEAGYRVLPLGANMPLEYLPQVAGAKHCSAIVLSGAVEPSARVLTDDLPDLVGATPIPVFVGGLASVYGCDPITKAGAEPLGRDIDHGLRRLDEVLSESAGD